MVDVQLVKIPPKKAKPTGGNLIREKRQQSIEASNLGLFADAAVAEHTANTLTLRFQEGAKKSNELRILGGTSRMIESLEVKISNAIVRASYGLTLIERRLLAMAIARLGEVREKIDYNDCPVIIITAQEWARTCNVANDTAYIQMSTAADRLYERSISIKTEDSRGRLQETKLRWTPLVQYRPGQASVAMQFSPAIMPYIAKLESEFTHFKLSSVLKLKSIYAMQLLQTCAQWQIKTSTPPISVENLLDAMEATPAQRASFSKFNQKVLGPAMEEVFNQLGIEIKMEYIKKGHTIVAVILHFPRNVF